MSDNTNFPRLEGLPVSLDDDGGNVVGGALQETLVELLDLSLTTKQLHWTVQGANFIAVHEQLDVVVDLLRAKSDEVAERLTALGLAPDGRVATVAQSTIKPVDSGAYATSVALAELVDRLGGVIASLRDRIEHVGEHDPGSEDLLIALLQDLEHHRWLLAAGRG